MRAKQSGATKLRQRNDVRIVGLTGVSINKLLLTLVYKSIG
jgi:hypothetical protein